MGVAGASKWLLMTIPHLKKLHLASPLHGFPKMGHHIRQRDKRIHLGALLGRQHLVATDKFMGAGPTLQGWEVQ